MKSFPARLARAVALAAALTVLAGACLAVSAREYRWYVGGGLAGTEVTGDLNANQVFFQDPVNGPFVYGVDVDKGRGLSFQAGVAITRFIGFETQFDVTVHDVTNPNVFPGEVHEAALASNIFALRGMLPLGSSLEFFVRLGYGGYALAVQQNVGTPGSTFRTDSTFSGTGPATGGGIAFSVGHIGIELASTTHKPSFDTVDYGSSRSATIPSQEMTFKTVNLIVTAQFGGQL